MARDYLESRIPEMDDTFDTFEMVITAAALQMVGSSQLNSIFSLMQKRVRGCELIREYEMMRILRNKII